jgi:hypothetical protein
VECDEVVDESGRSGSVRPRHAERHDLGRVDAPLREVRELDELVLRRQPQLETRGAESESEEAAEIYCRTLT